MADGSLGKAPDLPPDFQQAAAPAVPEIEPPKVTISFPVDVDVLAYFQRDTEPSDWARHMNGVLRFYMETNLQRDADFEADLMADALREPEPAP